MGGRFQALIGILSPERPVLVQTHDFPDHDALGAAYGLCELLRREGFSCSITYGGRIQSISLGAMISKLSITLEEFTEACEHKGAQTIVVDGSPAGATVQSVAGTLVGVVDHHPTRKKIDAPFADIREDMGACSSIVWTYWLERGLTPDKITATALLAGIELDTEYLSRRVSKTDLDAHAALYFLGDKDIAREIVHTSLTLEQLPQIGKAFSDPIVQGNFILAELDGDYSSELLSVLADFLLRLREITFAVAVETGGDEYRVSARSRDPALDAGAVVAKALSGIGCGGGHSHMAGGIIRSERYPGKGELAERFANIIGSAHETDRQADRG